MMQKGKIVVVGILVVLAAVALLLYLRQGQEESGGVSAQGLKVAATIFPLYDMARHIMGERGEAVLILPPGASEHTFEVTPAQIAKLQGAALVFQVGGLDDWIDPIARSLGTARNVLMSKGIALRKSAENSSISDPHYWLSAPNAMKMVSTMYDELVLRDPAGTAVYKKNLALYMKELEEADFSIRLELAPLAGRPMMTFHDAWYYFADTYGLQVIGTFERFGGEEPTPAHIADLVTAAKKHGIRVIFSELQLSDHELQAFAKDLDLKIFVLDPVGGVAGRDTLPTLFRYNAETIRSALSL